MVPHPSECFVAAKVKSPFKPGDAASVELLDGSVSESAACCATETTAARQLFETLRRNMNNVYCQIECFYFSCLCACHTVKPWPCSAWCACTSKLAVVGLMLMAL